MKKNIRRIIALTMALCMVFAFSAFASAATNEASASGGTATSSVTLSSTTDGSLGGDPAATKMSVTVPTVLAVAVGTDGSVTTATDAKIVNNSFGFEPYILKVAPDYPDIEFIACTNQASWTDDLPNTHNAFANIYEGRYLAGVVAGMKLQEMIDNGEITEDEAVIGYVGAFSFAEVISGFTAYYLGAKSVCPSVTMKVQFVGSWSDATLEANAAQALCDQGCVMISQHSDNTTPATVAQSNGVFHTGYNNDMISIAPEASLIGTRIDWSLYFEYAIEAVANGEEFDQDWCHGMDMGAVVMTALNEDIAAKGTAEKLAEVEQALHDGTLQVFDTSTFTVDGQELTSALALDTDGDFVADSEEAVFDGAFHESYFQSAPYFTVRIDGIEWLNEAF